MINKIIGLIFAFLGFLMLKYFPGWVGAGTGHQTPGFSLSGILIGIAMVLIGIGLLILG
jgi:hypothetical protein